MEITKLLSKYNDLKSKQHKIPSSLDRWAYDNEWRPIEQELRNVFIELAKQDISTAREVILDSIRTFRYPRGLEEQPFCKFISSLTRNASSNENNMLEVFCDNSILTEFYAKQGYLIHCEKTSNTYYDDYSIVYSSCGFRYLLNFCIKHNYHMIAEVILSMIAIDDIPTVIVETLVNINEKKGIDENATTIGLINRYIAQAKPPYRNHLNILILTKMNKTPDFAQCMEAIDSIPIQENYSWYLASCALAVKAYPSNLAEIIRFVLSKNSRLSEARDESSQLFYLIVTLLKNNGMIYEFVKNHYSLVEIALAKLNVYVGGYEKCECFFNAANKHDDAAMLNKLFELLSANPYVDNFEDLYVDLLSNQPVLSTQLIDVFNKWKPAGNEKCESIMLRYCQGNTLSTFSQYLANCGFADESLYIDIIRWHEKAANSDVEIIPEMVEALYFWIQQNEQALDEQLQSIDISSDLEKSSNLSWQKERIVPLIRKAGAVLFLKALQQINVNYIEAFLTVNNAAYRFVKGTIMSNDGWSADAAQVFREMYLSNKILFDNQILALANLLFFKIPMDTCVGLLDLLKSNEEEDARRNETLLYLVNMWNSEQIDLTSINSLQEHLFNQQITLKTMSFSFSSTLNGSIAPGGNDVLFHTVDAIANNNIELASKMLDLVFQKMDTSNSMALSVYYCLSKDNYIQIMLVNEKLFQFTCEDMKVYSQILRSLLGNGRFDIFAEIIHRSIDTGYSESEVCGRLYNLTLLKKDVEPIDSHQKDFLCSLASKFSYSAERKKLENRLAKI